MRPSRTRLASPSLSVSLSLCHLLPYIHFHSLMLPGCELPATSTTARESSATLVSHHRCSLARVRDTPARLTSRTRLAPVRLSSFVTPASTLLHQYSPSTLSIVRLFNLYHLPIYPPLISSKEPEDCTLDLHPYHKSTDLGGHTDYDAYTHRDRARATPIKPVALYI